MLYIYLLHLVAYTDVITTINTSPLNHFFDNYPTNPAHNDYLDPVMASNASWVKNAYKLRWRTFWRTLGLLCGGATSDEM
jgi:hypothetical protein